MLAKADLDARIRAQQNNAGIYPLELFCPACGTGHLAGGRGGKCRNCGTDHLVYRRHPARLHPVPRHKAD